MQRFILVPSLPLTASLQKLQTSEDTVITVDAKAAGKGKVTCKVQTPQGMELDMDVVENRDGTFDIYYTAPEPGKYVITIRFGGQNIPKSPFHVMVRKGDFKSSSQVHSSFDIQFFDTISFLSLSLSRYRQASNEPVVPRDTVDPLFRPVNFLVPFTPQQGEITGVTNNHSNRNSSHTRPQNISLRSLTFNQHAVISR